ncbi:MAG: DeoR/GlpR family DNA-binding transcription regulator, partial [Caldisericum sp.]
AFIATDGWNLDGTFNSSNFEVAIKRKMIELSKKKYLLADHTKCSKNMFIKVTDIGVFDAIITDSPVPFNIEKQLKEIGIPILFKE